MEESGHVPLSPKWIKLWLLANKWYKVLISIYTRSQQVKFHGKNPACHLVLYCLGVGSGFYIDRWLGGKTRRGIKFVTFLSTHLKYEIQVSTSFIGIQPRSLVYIMSMAVLQFNSRAEKLWYRGYGLLNLLNIWPYTEKVCQSPLEKRHHFCPRSLWRK